MSTPFEMLESRRMLSASVSFDATTGLLQVEGTKDNDEIRVTIVGSDPREGGADQVKSMGHDAVGEGGTLSTSKTTLEQSTPAGREGELLQGVSVYDKGELIFNSTWVRGPNMNITAVDVYGYEGTDRLNVYTWNSQIAARVFGGEGDDIIFTSAANSREPQVWGEAGDDYIQVQSGLNAVLSNVNAGDGNDQIEILRYADNASRNSAILAGAGNDNIFLSVESGEMGSMVMGGDGDDAIYGSARADLLYGENGDDVIFAGDGNDYLNGGNGSDALFGEDGDDMLDHGDTNGDVSDLINGGLGNDTAIGGSFDKIVEVEQLV